MDNVTHSLCGLALAQAGLKQRFGRGTTLALVLASNLPDVDIVAELAQDGFLLRRTLTHSVFGLVALSALAALVIRRWFPNLSYRAAFLLFLLGAGVHVLFDLINSYGVLPLHPAHCGRYELGWVFIVDLALAGVLALPLLLGRVPRWRPRLALFGRGALAGAVLYLGVCAAARTLSWNLVRAAEPAAEFTYVFPEPFGPQRFRGVAREGDAWRIYLVRPFGGRIELVETLATDTSSEVVRAARQTPRARRLEAFFKAPVWRADGDTAEVYDLRFRPVTLALRPIPFTIRIRPGDPIP